MGERACALPGGAAAGVVAGRAVYHCAMNPDPVQHASRLRIVLVGTQHPGNIGSAARALKTMGLARLVLVAPEKAPNAESSALAAGADDVLDAAPVVPDLATAVADCRLVLGCTARSRRVQLEQLLPREAAARAVHEAADGGEVALVFGRERTGLETGELQLCPAAVQVLAYELRLALLEAAGPREAVEPRDPPATHENMEGLFAHFADTLEQIDFHKGRAPESAMRKLRRLLLRARLDQREVRLLH